MTMIKDIPMTDLVAEIRRIAAESPNYVYQQVQRDGRSACEYVEYAGDQLIGSCIVGRALVNLGVDPASLTFSNDFTPTAWGLLRDAGHNSLAGEIDWIQSVQAGQDQGWAWGEAVQHADVRHPEVRQEA
jgi:hypothetical protein